MHQGEIKMHKEEILFKVRATLRKGWEGVGGKIEVTNKRIVFTSHKLNFTTCTVPIPLEDILEFRAYNFLGFIPNRILIKLKNGTEYHFIVAKRKELTRVVSSLIYE